MKRKKIILLAAVILIVLTAAFAIRYKTLNEKYPKPELKEYSQGETLTLEDMEVTLTDRQVLDAEEFFESYQIKDETLREYYQYNPTKFLVAEFQLKNIDDKDNNYSRVFLQDAIEYQAFSNGEDINFFSYVNEDGSWDGDLQPGAEKSVRLVYPIPKSLLSEKHWENAKKLEYSIVLKTYREKIVIK